MILTTPRSTHWLLNSVNGWRTSTPLNNIAQDEEGFLSLQTLPGEAQSFKPDLTGQLICPAATARDDCLRTWVLDAAAAQLLRIDRLGVIQRITEFGGVGRQPGQFDAPRGFVVIRDRVAVCDTGNHRVQVFAIGPYALTQLWGGGDGEGEFKAPWSIAADASGLLYIVDRGNRRVQKVMVDGTWVDELGIGKLADPTELAISPKGAVAVVDGVTQKEGGTVLIFASGSTEPTIVSDIVQPRAVAFDIHENLYVANASGVVYHCVPDQRNPGRYVQVGAGVTGLDGTAISLEWIPAQSAPDWPLQDSLLGIYQNSKGERLLWLIPVAGSFVTEGTYISDVLDSGIEGCGWDRVVLLGTLPVGSSVKVECFTCELPDQSGTCMTKPNETLKSRPSDGKPFTFAGSSTELSCLVQAQPGQLFQLKLTFQSDGRTSPKISGIQVFFPRESYLQYLPAVYQQDDESRAFLDRFLSVFQATFDGFDDRIDSIVEMFDPAVVPEKYFDWLAAWLEFPTDPTWSMPKKRAMLKNAASDYRARGTCAGLIKALKDYADLDVGIIEHFRLRQWPLLPSAGPLDGGSRLWSRRFYQRLQVGEFSQVGGFQLTNCPEPAAEPYDWGANEFSVFFPASPYDVNTSKGKVAAVVEREKPAHAKANYVPVFPRFRVGVQATVGIDSCIGGYSRLVLCTCSRLGYDAILNCSPARTEAEQLGASPRAVAGINTRLL
jgi:phage tail-like protein